VDAELFELIDGSRTLVDLVGEAEQRLGPQGPGRLAALLADLGERGLLSGVDGGVRVASSSRLARLMTPRELVLPAAGRVVEAVYRAGGRHLVTRPAAIAIVALSIAGIVAFAYLVAGRYGTPFVVAEHVGLGGAVFLAGRFALVALHELAHGLAVVACGRHVQRAGVKLVAIFPYGFVDTSDAWFEPRRRRLMITAAGPASDFALGGAFALASVALEGPLRDICFQLAFGAYVGAFTNLNPVLDRDGYQLLVDVLREPGLRSRAREHLRARLAGRATDASTPRAVRLYGVIGLGWMVLGALLVLGLAWRYYDLLLAFARHEEIVWGLFAGLALALFAPVLLVVGRGLLERHQSERVDGDA
jgi:putative peptide zinc metalloprotease protein